jgi:hypothetical protein
LSQEKYNLSLSSSSLHFIPFSSYTYFADAPRQDEILSHPAYFIFPNQKHFQMHKQLTFVIIAMFLDTPLTQLQLNET